MAYRSQVQPPRMICVAAPETFRISDGAAKQIEFALCGLTWRALGGELSEFRMHQQDSGAEILGDDIAYQVFFEAVI